MTLEGDKNRCRVQGMFRSKARVGSSEDEGGGFWLGFQE